MNDELQKQLAAMLAKLSAYAGDGAKFAAEQIPPLVQEKIAYGRVSETLYLALFVGIAIVAWRMLPKAFRLAKSGDALSGDEVAGAIATGVNGIAFIVFGLLALFQVDYALKAWFAPRLYIVEWLTSGA